MSDLLYVFRETIQAGELRRDKGESYRFRYNEEYLVSPEAQPLSLSLSFQKGFFSASTSRAFFANLLPGNPP